MSETLTIANGRPVHLDDSGLRELVAESAHWLPTQGPIEVFVHHNTLHALEEERFHDAVVKGFRRYDSEPYLAEGKYRELLATGRILREDLEIVLKQSLPAPSTPWISETLVKRADRISVRLAMLCHVTSVRSAAEVRWAIQETELSKAFRTSSTVRHLWQVCEQACREIPANQPDETSLLRPRDLLLQATGVDVDRYMHDVLIRFLAAFTDQGYSSWILPRRDEGIWKSFCELYAKRESLNYFWSDRLGAAVRRLREQQIGPEQVVEDVLEAFQIGERDRQEFITQTLLAIRGWAGMIWQLESQSTTHAIARGSLFEMLAVQLLLEREAIAHFGSEWFGQTHGAATIVTRLQSAPRDTEDSPSTTRQVAMFSLFQVAHQLEWEPAELENLRADDWRLLLQEITGFDALTRRRLFHEAYEMRYRRDALEAFAAHTQVWRTTLDSAGDDPREQPSHQARSAKPEQVASDAPAECASRPSFQIVCCIDDREESFRRHLEEIDVSCETFGAAGFFAVAMYYRGAADGFYQPLCPGSVTPSHYVQEDVGYTFEGVHRSRARLREQLGNATYQVQTHSRTLVGGVFAGLLGAFSSVPLVARVLFPRSTARIRKRFGALLTPPPVTQLHLERYAAEPGPEGDQQGYSVEEMAGVVVRLLQDIGLTQTERFSRLFVVCGHGSSSLNNPHESAYCCGACAGKRGGPNARAFAAMANDWRVRQLVDEAGISIPEDTVFVGAYHNTCDDSVVFFDLDRLPPSHRSDLEAARGAIQEARTRNAHERCRRFHHAALNLSPVEALHHVEARAQDISQVRPEYNHATNAMCIVGRREWSRGLFLDRRAFLTSYDPRQDDAESSILLRILSAAIPVCAGINLEYYFSSVDPTGYGAGSKLPHNLVSLLGVMEGTSSDLRTGLYEQMVEIHEPMRLLFLIETQPDAMLSIMDREPTIGRLCRNEWVQLAVISPETSTIHHFHNGQFERFQPSLAALPRVAQSHLGYQGNRDHLPFFAVQTAEAK